MKATYWPDLKFPPINLWSAWRYETKDFRTHCGRQIKNITNNINELYEIRKRN